MIGPVHDAFHRPGTRAYAIVQTTIWILIVVSIALLAVELAVEPAGAAERWLADVDRGILWIFAVELALRVGSYRPRALNLFDPGPVGRLREHVVGRLRFMLSPLMLIDLLTVAALVPALRGLRALRLLRLVRTLHVFRYGHPFQGLDRAFRDNGLLFGFALSLLGASVLLGGGTLYLVEEGPNPDVNDLTDGFWWAIVTLTTVGFGDISPVTQVGRVVGAALMVAGLFNIALFAGIVGSTLLGAVLSIREEQFRMAGTVDHVVICGWDAGARLLLDAIVAEFDPDEVPLIVFAPGQRPDDLPPEFRWSSGDPTKESELDKVRMSHARAAILVGERDVPPQRADATTILTAFTIRAYMGRKGRERERTKPLYVAAEILDVENVDHARAAGADEVIETTRLGFSLLAHAVAMPGTAAVMGRVAAAGAHSIFVGQIPDDLAPSTFSEVARRVKERTGALVIGVGAEGSDEHEINPSGERAVEPGDRLVYLAARAVLEEEEAS